jgi:hypothetical protein
MMRDPNEAQAQQEDVLASPAWLQATVEDIHVVDIDAPLAGCMDANGRIISDIYQKAAADLESENAVDTAKGRVYRMLAAAMQMHFKPRERYEPFGPMFVMDGRRSAIPPTFVHRSMRWPLPLSKRQTQC